MTMLYARLKALNTPRNLEFGVVLVGILVSLAVPLHMMFQWRDIFSVPIVYGGDGLWLLSTIKAIGENGWFLENHRLGFPGISQMYDFPMSDSLFWLFIRGLLVFWSRPETVLNLFYLLSFPLTFLATYGLARHLRISMLAALFVGLGYALVPYHFQRGTGHLFLASYYMLPIYSFFLFSVLDGKPVFLESKRSILRLSGLGVLILLCGSSGIYYAFFMAFFTCVAVFYSGVVYKIPMRLVDGGILVALLLVAVLLNVQPTLLYHARYGSPGMAGFRPFGDSERYGLKFAQLVLPSAQHALASFAHVGAKYASRVPLVNENSTATLGLLGTMGFLASLVSILFYGSKSRSGKLGLLNLTGFLLATIGGVGVVVAMFLLPGIRCYNRISIWIALFSFLAAGLGVDFVLDWLRLRGKFFHVSYTLVVSILIFGLWELVPRMGGGRESASAVFHADKAFVKGFEKELSPDAKVFQLPFMFFPENGTVHNMGDYEHFRPYFHSENLRWSYGANRARGVSEKNAHWAGLPPREMTEELRGAGFSAVFINRGGYKDGGIQLQSELTQLGAKVIGESPAFVVLRLSGEQ